MNFWLFENIDSLWIFAPVCHTLLFIDIAVVTWLILPCVLHVAAAVAIVVWHTFVYTIFIFQYLHFPSQEIQYFASERQSRFAGQWILRHLQEAFIEPEFILFGNRDNSRRSEGQSLLQWGVGRRRRYGDQGAHCRGQGPRRWHRRKVRKVTLVYQLLATL